MYWFSQIQEPATNIPGSTSTSHWSWSCFRNHYPNEPLWCTNPLPALWMYPHKHVPNLQWGFFPVIPGSICLNEMNETHERVVAVVVMGLTRTTSKSTWREKTSPLLKCHCHEGEVSLGNKWCWCAGTQYIGCSYAWALGADCRILPSIGAVRQSPCFPSHGSDAALW